MFGISEEQLWWWFIGIFLGTVICTIQIYNIISSKERKSVSTQVKSKQQTKSTQVQSKQQTGSVQTDTISFTERITNNGAMEVSSAELFDNSCEICESGMEKEAVGFCKVCEKYMCLNCCKHHEKIPLSESHVILGKESFAKANGEKPLFEKCLVPTSSYCFQKCKHIRCKDLPTNYYTADHYIEVLGLANIPGSGELCCITKTYQSGDLKITCNLQDKANGNVTQQNMLKCTTIRDVPFDFCTRQADPMSMSNDIKVDAIYFTIPNKNWVYNFIYTGGGDESNYVSIASSKKQFHTNGECYGIALFDNGLAISLYIPTSYMLPNWQVQFITFSGTVKNQIYYDTEGKPLFKEPKHLTSNDAHNVVYVSDQGNHSIIALDTKGTTLFIFKHETIKGPQGITCDAEENIYIASGSKVIQLDQHGKKSRIILSSNVEKPNALVDVCYNNQSGKLAVVNNTLEVTLFKFLP